MEQENEGQNKSEFRMSRDQNWMTSLGSIQFKMMKHLHSSFFTELAVGYAIDSRMDSKEDEE